MMQNTLPPLASNELLCFLNNKASVQIAHSFGQVCAVTKVFNAFRNVHPFSSRIAKRNVVNVLGGEHRGPRHKFLRDLIGAVFVQFDYDGGTVRFPENVDGIVARTLQHMFQEPSHVRKIGGENTSESLLKCVDERFLFNLGFAEMICEVFRTINRRYALNNRIQKRVVVSRLGLQDWFHGLQGAKNITPGITRRALNVETFPVLRMRAALFAVGCMPLLGRGYQTACKS